MGNNIVCPFFQRVFRPFTGPENGFLAAGNEPLDKVRICAVGGGTFHGVENAELF